MPIRVLVVDDSTFFCQQLIHILNSDPALKVIGVAQNGREAIQKIEQLKPDVVTMDVEMPVMDGITAVKQIMKTTPVPVLMLSSLTFEGAKLTLDALDAGAVDFHLKSYESLNAKNTASSRLLIEKIKTVAGARAQSFASHSTSAPLVTPPYQTPSYSERTQSANPCRQNRSIESKDNRSDRASIRPENPRPRPPSPRATRISGAYKILIIGASTGGPVVVQKILQNLPQNFPIPILVVQHMPATFTGAFASRLNGLSPLNVSEARDGQSLKAGDALIAPGGKQIYFEVVGGNAMVKVREADPRVNYQPCVDVTFASASKSYGGQVFALVLTGMGADGKEGAKLLKQKGATVWAQNQATCVVYGMPMAIVNAGLADKVLAGDEFSGAILRELCF